MRRRISKLIVSRLPRPRHERLRVLRERPRPVIGALALPDPAVLPRRHRQGGNEKQKADAERYGNQDGDHEVTAATGRSGHEPS